MSKNCLSDSYCFADRSHCLDCKYSYKNLDNADRFDSRFSPLIPGKTHAQDKIWEKEKKNLEAKTLKAKTAHEKRKLKKRADKTENIVFKTLNSGRVYKDGDLSTQRLTIDVKMQSKTLSPKIDRGEWLKVQEDAKRALKDYGVLAIVNKIGETFYVIPEEMFKEMVESEKDS